MRPGKVGLPTPLWAKQPSGGIGSEGPSHLKNELQDALWASAGVPRFRDSTFRPQTHRTSISYNPHSYAHRIKVVNSPRKPLTEMPDELEVIHFLSVTSIRTLLTHLQERLRSHASAFDSLLSLIPAKLYYGEDVSVSVSSAWKISWHFSSRH